MPARAWSARTAYRSSHLAPHPRLACCVLRLQPIAAVRFCPVLFERGEAAPGQQAAAAGEDAWAAGAAGPPQHAALPFDLPYKMVFAVRRREGPDAAAALAVRAACPGGLAAAS